LPSQISATEVFEVEVSIANTLLIT
jgi:hypothetical protein